MIGSALSSAPRACISRDSLPRGKKSTCYSRFLGAQAAYTENSLVCAETEVGLVARAEPPAVHHEDAPDDQPRSR